MEFLLGNINTKEYETFFAFLNSIRKIPSLMEYYGKDFFESMLTLLNHVEDKYDQATLIETIMEYADEYSLSEVDIERIFEQYLICITEQAGNIKDMSVCMNDFINAGIDIKEIVGKLEGNLEKEQLIKLLSFLYRNHKAEFNEIDSHLLKEIHQAYCISQRSGIIAQFLLLTNPYVRRYAGLSEILFLYDSYEGVYQDAWRRGLLPNMKNMLIDFKILSLKEICVLEELDNLINTHGECLDSEKVEQLYYDFFRDKDPFEVIFTLPQ